jgi:TRAP-type mannitol/chloroaromatic compound transport system substrate-binding protein
MLGWLYEGNGTKLWEKFYNDAGYNVKVWPLAIYANEGAGWFTKRIEKVEDWKGTKIRIGGFAGGTVKKLGAVPTLIPFGEIFPGLEKGVIDAAEMGLPANDLEAGLHKVAKFYHMPSWHQPYTIIEIVMNMDVWNGMSDAQQAQWEASVRQANVWSMTHSNAIQNAALKTLQEEKGVEIVKFDDEMLKAMRAAFNETMDELMATDPEVKMLMDDLTAFMEDYKAWENIGSIGRNSLWD